MKVTSIKAKIHSDDFVLDESFDALPYFEKASDETLMELMKIDFRGDYPADYVATHMPVTPIGVTKVLDYVRLADNIGYEVVVDSEDATNWIKQNKSYLLK